MNYQHRLDTTGQCVQRGDKAELRCYQILKSMGRDVRLATVEEQKKHIDLVIIKNGKEITVDVKARKKIGRGDNATSDDYIWLELFTQNMPGWLIGKEDFVAFEIDENAFYMVEREKLLIYFIQNTLPEAKIVNSPIDSCHKWYKRENGQGKYDIITTIRYDELFSICGYEIRS